jgi:hypothetical protein
LLKEKGAIEMVDKYYAEYKCDPATIPEEFKV